MNVVVLSGRLLSDPTPRELPSGEVIWSLDVSTEIGADGPAPCVAVSVVWAGSELPEWTKGTELAVTGIVRRRFFRAGGSTQSRTEVVAAKVSDRAHAGDRVLYCPDQVAPAASRLMPPGLDHLAFPHLPGDPWPTERVDWVDYKARNAIDSRAYAQTIGADRPGQGLFVVFSGSYKTHEGTCEALVDELAKVRGNPENLIMADGNTYFESAGLFYFGPKAPG